MEDRLRSEFEQRTGRKAWALWTAPGRVNLIGEHTDYNEGYVLPLAIDRRTTVAGALNGESRIRAWSRQAGGEVRCELDNLRPRSAKGWGAYLCGTAWSLQRAGVEVRGCDLVVDSTVPVGAGLSSSAALETSVAMALADISGGALEREELAMVAHRAEVEFVGVPSGVMDQMVSSLARPDHALFLDARTLAFEHVPFRPSEAALALTVIDTRVKHRLADGQYAERRRSCEETAAALDVASLRDVKADHLPATMAQLTPVAARRVRHVVTENGRVLATVQALREKDYSAVGSQLFASHQSLRDDFEVSSPELDLAVEVARAEGALGARMTGGGFGGSAISLISENEVEQLRTSLSRSFELHGFAAPDVFCVAASGGAHRVR